MKGEKSSKPAEGDPNPVVTPPNPGVAPPNPGVAPPNPPVVAQAKTFTECEDALTAQLNVTESAFAQLRVQIDKLPAYKRDAARAKARDLEILLTAEKSTVARFDTAKEKYKAAAPEQTEEVSQANAERLEASRQESKARLADLEARANELRKKLSKA